MSTDDVVRWAPGAQVLYQELWGEALLAARPVTVAADDARGLALYSHPGATYRSAAIGSARHAMTLQERVAALVSPGPRTYVPRTASDAHVLVLLSQDRWSAVWLLWSQRWDHLGWYVNLQQPARRTARGVEIRDCALDIVVQPDRSWRWKDRDELDALCERGFFSRSLAEQVEMEARHMLEVIESWGSPFRDGWERWRPDPAWPVPQLPCGWDVLGR